MSEWKEIFLGQCISVSSGEGLPESKMNPGQYIVYGGNGVAGFHNEFLFEKEQLIIGRVGAHCGNIHITKAKSWITDNALIVSFIENDNDLLFWYYLLRNLNLRENAFQSAQPVITGGIISKIKVKTPALSAQRKIARILSTADSVIEKTQAAIAKYKAIKQGMLHDLFTRGIDIQTGKLRPRYEDAPELYKESSLGFIPVEWEVMQVADVSENLDGKRIPVKQENRDKQAEIYPYYGASGIIDYVEDYIFDEPLILLGEDGENVVSRNLPLAFKVEGKIWVNNHAHVLRPISGITTIEFLCEALESIDYSPIVSGSAQPKITQGHLSKILVRIPEIEEQIKISERLVSINKKLHTEQTYLHKLQQLKAGLMSDLLSGRVKVSESQMEGIKG
ncbi:MAG: restriction endonuclease subunit S [Planctomycetia bacterium]|nr:restriction endonuclease subunit S [Planctomycetia bacterium]